MANKIFSKTLIALNILAGIAMCFIGYSDRVNPVSHPDWACCTLFFPITLLVVLGFLLFWAFSKPKNVFISVLFLLIGGSPVLNYCPISPLAHNPDEKNKLKVISYNVDNFSMEKDTAEMAERISDYLMGSDADIICLQEAPLEGKRLKEYQDGFTYVMTYANGSRSSLTCLSKYPILRVEEIKYDSETNLSACFYIQMGKKVIRVINNHFESTKIPTEERKQFKGMVKGALKDKEKREESKQMFRTLADAMQRRAPQVDAVAKYVGEDSKLTILMGDFNDSPVSYAHYKIADILNDCYVASGKWFGFSYMENWMYVRIDHTFCSSDWNPVKSFVDNSVTMSDHYPIVTIFDLDKEFIREMEGEKQ